VIYLYDGINIEWHGGQDHGATFTSGAYMLPDTISCVVTEERNGQFSLVLQYPIGGVNWAKIIPDAVIMSTPRPDASVEPFRIYEIQQVLDGIVTARANHLVYDLDGLNIASPATTFQGKKGITAVLNQLTSSGQFVMLCFELANDGITDTTTELNFGNTKYCSIWKCIGIIAAAFNAEMKYTWNRTTRRCTITFCAARGTAKQTVISYKDNIVNLNRKLDYGGLYSRVVLVWFGQNGTFMQGYADTGYTGRVRSLWVDVSDQYESTPTQPELNDAAQAYVNSHDFNPSSDLSVEFIPTETQTDFESVARVGTAIVGISIVGEYDTINPVLYLCDTAKVDASVIGVTATAKCVRVVYNVITNKYDSVTIGTIQSDIVDTILKIAEG
jgi:phage-related protein